MTINKIDRYKILIRYAINQGIAETQKDLGRLMGYSNESSFSQIINGKVDRPKEFMSKLKALIPRLNVDWIDTGEGDMIFPEASNIQIAMDVEGDAHQTNGNNNSVNSSDVLMKALDEIAAQRKLTERTQEMFEKMMSELIEIIKKESP